jgi:DeoR/GlpR family transcriptional regulator of sugar metabolism
MIANQRREKIPELLKEDGSAKIIKWAKIFKVTEVTIRQYLEKLESEEFILREQGGAFFKNVEQSMKSFTLLNQDNPGKKKIIGRKAITFTFPRNCLVGYMSLPFTFQLSGQPFSSPVNDYVSIIYEYF